ncbi:MAG: 50S ribosomal protein L22 [Candidatus Magasanikbacteria bacterium RIFCSPHIGHO2_02_FULL_47_14]|uniref:Large ribosomal subunit protein uL22 n=1 Tax=Candidatus Magasanikbacteria bacterium RIFCSPHIGHO2_02_FULL_47_14 TaxID=1798680 RepID=A0A1F6LYX2_9BACT|nr:MAG: 50S ribosomal protein L22 [Candidatus Magasanikbacteria bacterium RIFCSPHIGHO2_02_FULL_47_14]
MKMQTTAKLRHLRMSPRKIRLLVDLVRGMNAQDAITQLSHSQKIAARPLRKLIASAIANALHNHNMKEETLVIKQAMVDSGSILYRWQPRAFGRAAPIRKRTSHITLVLEGDAAEAKAKKEETLAEKADGSTAETKIEKKAEPKKRTRTTKKKAITS